MALLSRKGLLAIAAVIDVALHGRDAPVSAKVLAERHALPARHLEPFLQALVRVGILKASGGRAGAMSWPMSAAASPPTTFARRRHHRGRQRPAATAGSTLLHDVVIRRSGRRSGRSRSRSPESISRNWCERPRRFRTQRLDSESSLQHLAAIARVHDLDSFGSIPLVRKVPMIRKR